MMNLAKASGTPSALTVPASVMTPLSLIVKEIAAYVPLGNL